MQSRDPGNVTQAFELVAMTDCALNSFAARTVLHQSLALEKASGRYIRDEPRFRIAAGGASYVLRKLDNAIAERLHAAAWQRQTLPAFHAHVALGHRIGLNHFHPAARLESREPIRRLLDVLIRHAL